MSPDALPRRPIRRLALSFAGAALTLLVGAAGAMAVQTLERATSAVEHTVVVLDVFQALLRDALESESSQRGYLLTGDEHYLSRYAASGAGIDAKVSILRALTIDDAHQQARIDSLRAGVREKRAEMDSTIVARRSGRLDVALAMVRSNRGVREMNDVRGMVAEGEAQEHAILAVRSAARDRARLLTLLIIVPGAIAACVLTVLAVRVAQRELREQRGLNETLETQTALLRDQAAALARQAEELGTTNTSLAQALGEADRLRQITDEASRAKSDFIASMSHELRTPLNAILGYENLIVEGIAGPVTPQQHEFLRRIHTSASHLLGLIEDVLSLSRIEAGQVEIRWSMVDVDKALRDAAAMVEPAARAKGLELVVESGEKATMIETDPQRLGQCLINLASNAVKYTDAGVVRFVLHASADDVTVEVTDTGIGIAPRHLDKIFDAFWQVEQSTTRRVGGAGLGLNVTRRLARLLGGEVTAESTVGRGSTFRLRLPTRRQQAAMAGSTAANQ